MGNVNVGVMSTTTAFGDVTVYAYPYKSTTNCFNASRQNGNFYIYLKNVLEVEMEQLSCRGISV